MTKIVLAANTSWYLWNFHKNLIKALCESGYEVAIVAPRDEYSDRFSSLPVSFHEVHLSRRSINPFKELALLNELRQVYKGLKPDWVLNFTPKLNIFGTVAARLAGAKVINNVTGLGTVFVKRTPVTYLVGLLLRLTQPLATKVLFQNTIDREWFLRHRMIRRRNALKIPGSGVDLKRFRPSSRDDDGKVRFLLVARMLKPKGVIEFVRAAYRLKKLHDDMEFWVLGIHEMDHPEAISSQHLKKWHDEGTVKLYDATADVVPIMSEADCVVLPSFYREGLPRVLLEAAALAKPIITTNSPGCRDAVDDGETGYLCTPKSVSSLQQMMRKIVDLGYDARINMGLLGRKKAKQTFCVSRVIDTYLSVIESETRPNK